MITITKFFELIKIKYQLILKIILFDIIFLATILLGKLISSKFNLFLFILLQPRGYFFQMILSIAIGVITLLFFIAIYSFFKYNILKYCLAALVSNAYSSDLLEASNPKSDRKKANSDRLGFLNYGSLDKQYIYYYKFYKLNLMLTLLISITSALFFLFSKWYMGSVLAP